MHKIMMIPEFHSDSLCTYFFVSYEYKHWETGKIVC